MIRLRGHHLLCSLTYRGQGYSLEFAANYDRIIERMAVGESIRIVDGPDEVCAPIQDQADAHCHRSSVIGRDRLAEEAVSRLLGRRVSTGTVLELTAADYHRLRTSFAEGGLRQACTGCEWHDLCSTTARQGFASARLTASTQERSTVREE